MDLSIFIRALSELINRGSTSYCSLLRGLAFVSTLRVLKDRTNVKWKRRPNQNHEAPI